MTNNNNTNSDETVVNPTYTAISHKDTTTRSNTTGLQINQAHNTIINEEEIINSSDETIINPTYGAISDRNISSRSDEARKLQTQRNSACATTSDNKDITTNGYETAEPPRNAINDDITTIGNDTVVNPAYML